MLKNKTFINIFIRLKLIIFYLNSFTSLIYIIGNNIFDYDF
jgi:hypothetical protein